MGVVYHHIRDWKRALSIMAFFLVTGVILSLYLNMPDSQPRERDYAFIGSYFAFSIWIGIGISFFQQKIRRKKGLIGRGVIKAMLNCERAVYI